jgi:hypothetical protein
LTLEGSLLREVDSFVGDFFNLAVVLSKTSRIFELLFPLVSLLLQVCNLIVLAVDQDFYVLQTDSLPQVFAEAFII